MSEYKKCPHCGEQILAVAKKCKYCREWIVDSSKDPHKEESVVPQKQTEEVSSDDKQKESASASQTIEIEQGGSTRSNTNSVAVFFKTHDPTEAEKVLYMYELVPTKWFLDEFRLENGILTISTLIGNKISGPVDEMKIRIQTDKTERREVYVWHGKEKLTFKEMPGMLSDNEWDALFDIMASFPNYGTTIVGKIVKILGIILSIISILATCYFEFR